MRLKRLLPLLVAVPLVLALAFVARAQAAKPKAPAGAATAEVKVGTGIEKMELQGEAKTFTVAAGAKIHVWTKVTGAADTTHGVMTRLLEADALPDELQAWLSFGGLAQRLGHRELSLRVVERVVARLSRQAD